MQLVFVRSCHLCCQLAKILQCEIIVMQVECVKVQIDSYRVAE